MPMKTTLVTRRSRRAAARAKCSTWSTISSAVRSRRRPRRPEAQKAQRDGAADLGGHANGGAASRTHEHGLDRLRRRRCANSVLRAAPRAAARGLAPRRAAAGADAPPAPPAEPRAGRHLGEVGHQSPRQGLVDLARAIGGLAEVGHDGGDCVVGSITAAIVSLRAQGMAPRPREQLACSAIERTSAGSWHT